VFDPGVVTATQRDMDPADHRRMCEEMNVREFGVVRFPPDDRAVMPVAVSGFGDGGYPVYELVRDGRRVGVEVVFIGPEVLAESAASERP
jgi:hypothetical protein